MTMYIKDTLKASISGNAATATKLATARTFTIGNTSKTFDGSANVSWTLAEIGASASGHTHSYLPLSGGEMTGRLRLTTAATTTDASTPTQLAYGLLGAYGTLKVLGNTDTSAGADNEYVHIAAGWGLSPAVDKGIVVYGTYANCFGKKISTEGHTHTLSSLGAASSKFYKDNAFTITVAGDANTYYPVRFEVSRNGFPYFHLNISRGYGDAAPNTWNNSTHRGGLTLSIRWSGDVSWGGNDRDIRVDEFHETYSTMVAGLANSTAGLIVWLRGGTANYVISSEYGNAITATVYTTTYTDGNSTAFAARTNTNNVNEEIKKRFTNRYNGELYDRGNRVYSASNKPTPADIGAAASSHGTHVSYGGNGSATTVSRSDHTHSYLSTGGGTLTGALTISGNGKNLTMGTGGADVYITNSASGKYLQLKDNGTLSYSDQVIYHSGNPQPTVAKWTTARTLTIGATGKSVDGSGNVSWSLQEIMKGQGLNAGTAMNTLYYNNAGVDHVGRLSCYRNTNSNLDYVQVGLYNVANSGTVNTLNVYPSHSYTANEFWCASNIRVNGKRLHITASAPGSPSTGDIWIDI